MTTHLHLGGSGLEVTDNDGNTMYVPPCMAEVDGVKYLEYDYKTKVLRLNTAVYAGLEELAANYKPGTLVELQVDPLGTMARYTDISSIVLFKEEIPESVEEPKASISTGILDYVLRKLHIRS